MKGGSIMTNSTQQATLLAPRLPLSVLLIEDDSNDAELCLRVLERPEFEIHLDIVKTPQDFRSRLRETCYDIILADYDLGDWTGLDALNLLREEGGDSPFILVTGALGEQRAVECLKSGVSDYVLKDHLERLPVAMLRALEEKGQRVEQACEERSLHMNEAKFRALAEAIPAAVFIEQGTRSCYVNHAAESVTGYAREELLTMNFWQLLLPRSRDEVLQRAIKSFNEEEAPCRYKIEILTKNKEVRHLDVTVGLFGLEGSLAALITAFDITHLHGDALHQSASAGH
jgi:PAS domain S-box-containing protein